MLKTVGAVITAGLCLFMASLFAWSLTDDVQQRCLEHRVTGSSGLPLMACLVVDNFPAADDGVAALGSDDGFSTGTTADSRSESAQKAAIEAEIARFSAAVDQFQSQYGGGSGRQGVFGNYEAAELIDLVLVADTNDGYCVVAYLDGSKDDAIYDSMTGQISYYEGNGMERPSDEACSVD